MYFNEISLSIEKKKKVPKMAQAIEALKAEVVQPVVHSSCTMIITS